ncbi:MAG: hypothetical protein V4678_02690 [Patescibacteria group bacterium]
MKPAETFDTLARHADTQHEFIARAIGQDAIYAAVEMRNLNRDAITGLSDDEFATYLLQRDDEPVESPEDTYLEGVIAFSDAADSLFGNIQGYRLVGADEKGLFIQMDVAAPEDALAAQIRISAKVVANTVSVQKVHQIMGGELSGKTELVVTEEDVAIAHEALDRLRMVNESLS